jgi:lysine N6-hydroxylase
MIPETYDLVGIGIGPGNLALAALAEPVPGLRALFLDENPVFSWQPGAPEPSAAVQRPFLADLVSLVDPTSRHSYLAHLRDTGRLFAFYFAGIERVPRTEYEAYCRAVAAALASCRFDSRVTAVQHCALPTGEDGFAVSYTTADGGTHTVLAATVVLGIGSEPVAPSALAPLCREAGPLVSHSADYPEQTGWIRSAADVTVLGSGRSGAHIVLDLLRRWHRPGHRLRWLTRGDVFGSAERSKLGLEDLTPDYADHLRLLPEAEPATPPAGRRRHFGAASADTLDAIREELDARALPHGIAGTGVTLMPGVEAVSGSRAGEVVALALVHRGSGRRMTVRTERLILATGYAPRKPDFLSPIDAFVQRDAQSRLLIDRDYRVRLTGTRAALFAQNAELHNDGIGTPDLGLGAYRAAVILNAVTGRPVYPLPSRTAHVAFAPAVAAAADPGIALTTEDPGNEQYRSQYHHGGSGDPRAVKPRHAAQRTGPVGG